MEDKLLEEWIKKKPRTTGELQAYFLGEDMESYEKLERESALIRADAKRYIDAPPSKWPEIVPNWDYAPSSQRYALDGLSMEKFRSEYPDGLCLGRVLIQDLDKMLCCNSRKSDDEIWSFSCKNKLAYLIVYMSQRRLITPPVITPFGGEVAIEGGNHRYTILRSIKEKEIPFYIDPAKKHLLNKSLQVKWI